MAEYGSFGPAVSDGIPIRAGQKLALRVSHGDGGSRTLDRVRFGIHQLEPQGTGEFIGDPSASPFGENLAYSADVDRAIAVNTATNTLLWESAISPAWTNVGGNFFSRSRAQGCVTRVDGSNLFVFAGVGEVLGLSRTDGQVVWRTGLDLSTGNPNSVFVDDEDTVYGSTTGGWLWRINAATGNLMWEVGTGLTSPQAIKLDVGGVYVGGQGRGLRFFDRDGQQQWAATLQSASQSSLAYIDLDADFLYVVSSIGFDRSSRWLVDKTDGSTLSLTSNATIGWVRRTLLDGDHAYIVTVDSVVKYPRYDWSLPSVASVARDNCLDADRFDDDTLFTLFVDSAGVGHQRFRWSDLGSQAGPDTIADAPIQMSHVRTALAPGPAPFGRPYAAPGSGAPT
jgi:hypothetical protein